MISYTHHLLHSACTRSRTGRTWQQSCSPWVAVDVGAGLGAGTAAGSVRVRVKCVCVYVCVYVCKCACL